MTAVPANTMGGHVKGGTMPATDAAVLARALFDGKRELTIGGRVVITPAFDKMTSHEQLILKGLFLKAQVKP